MKSTKAAVVTASLSVMKDADFVCDGCSPSDHDGQKMSVGDQDDPIPLRDKR